MLTDKEIVDNVIKYYKKNIIGTALFELEKDSILDILGNCLGKLDKDIDKDIEIARKKLDDKF